MNIKRMISLTLATTLSISLLCGCGSASENETTEAAWPSDDVTIYVPAGAGGSSDTLVRQYAERMEEITGRNFIIVNDTTGANSVAYETVRNAEPDGLTLLAYHGGMCLQYASGQYDHSLDEFTVLGNLTSDDLAGCGVWVPADSPFNTFEELIAYAKEHPGELKAGVETNNLDHLIAAIIQERFDVEFSIVSAGSNAEKIPLLMGNNLDVCFLSPAGVADYQTSGDLKCLIMLGEGRTDLLPEVPALVESGEDSITLSVFFFLAGPADIPEDICQAVDQVIAEISEDDSIYEVLDTYGLEWIYSSQEDAQEAASKMQQAYIEAYAAME
ncbi:MAG: tripartite tricarboxylate transporter substrate binding protein [Lachnospiraceae bacterium]|nr:tripartite tricarboxylate transporter substrate binding protein [Lachnospiraceae bacterium]